MPLLVVGPYLSSFEKLVEHFHEGEEVHLIECNNPFEAIPKVRALGGGVLVCSIDDNNKSAINVLAMCKGLRQFLREGTLKVVVGSKLHTAGLLKKLADFGVKDIVDHDVKEKQLIFKVTSMVKRLKPTLDRKKKSQEKEETQKKEKNQAAFAQDSSNGENGGSRFRNRLSQRDGTQNSNNQGMMTIKSRNKNGVAADEMEFKDPLKLQSDCWLIRGGNARKVMGRWLISLIGPANISAGRWNDATDDGTGKAWRWTPNNPEKDPFLKEKGDWIFYGHRPDFINDRWSFVGKEPKLVFMHQGKSYGSKIEFVDGKLYIAKDSQIAIAKIPDILASLQDRKLSSKLEKEKEYQQKSLEGKNGDLNKSEAREEESAVSKFLSSEFMVFKKDKEKAKDYQNKLDEEKQANGPNDKTHETQDKEAQGNWNEHDDDCFLDDQELEKLAQRNPDQVKKDAEDYLDAKKRGPQALADYLDKKEKRLSKEMEATQEGMGPGKELEAKQEGAKEGKELEATQEGMGLGKELEAKQEGAKEGKELEATQEGAGPGKDLEATQKGSGAGTELDGEFEKEKSETEWNDQQNEGKTSRDESKLPPGAENLPVHRYPYEYFGSSGGTWEEVSAAGEGKKWFVFVSAELDSGIVQDVEKIGIYYTYLGLVKPGLSTNQKEWLFRGERPKTYHAFDKLPPHVQTFLKRYLQGSGPDMSGIQGKGNAKEALEESEDDSSPKEPAEASIEKPKRYRDGVPIDEDEEDDSQEPNANTLAEKLKKELDREGIPEGTQEAIDQIKEELEKKERPPEALSVDPDKSEEEQVAEAPQKLAAPHAPGPSISPLAIGFLVAELMSRVDSDTAYIMKRFCQYVSASLGDLSVDLWIPTPEAWKCVASSGEEKAIDAAELLKGTQITESQILDKNLLAPVPGSTGVICISGDGAEGVDLNYASAVSGMLKGAVLGYQRQATQKKEVKAA